MDARQALAPGAALNLHTRTGSVAYTIRGEVGRGGSSIVYDASYDDNLGNHKLVRIKECYPAALQLTRQPDGALAASAGDEEAFTAAMARMTEAYQRNSDLFLRPAMGNAVANTSEIHRANGTVYIVSVYLNGRTFGDYHGDTLRDCVSLVLGAARALKRIHKAGYLYLDLKPDNILTLEGSLDLVQLFDFDSMVPLEALARARDGEGARLLRASYTRGFAPLELVTGRLRQMGVHTDLFSLGAVLFDALWGRTPTSFDGDLEAEYDFGAMAFSGKAYQDALYRALTAFFHRTLASYCGDRYSSDDEAIAALEEILALSDETRAWVCSTPMPVSPVFYGREAEIAALSQLLRGHAGGVVSLCGMGGIGKSTLARRCLQAHREDWDAVVWLYDEGALDQTLADDGLLRIHTVTRMREESTDQYLRRKLRALTDLAATGRILLALDNFEPDHIDQLAALQRTGVTLLLISRERLAEGLFPTLCVERLEAGDLAQLFAHYSHCDLTEAANRRSFDAIIHTIDGHTLLTELLARQVAKSYLDLPELETMVAGIGLRDLPAEKVDYVRDASAVHETILRILDRLVEIDQFSDRDKCCVKLLSLFNAPGIEAGLFKRLAELDSLDFVNDLEASGWVKAEENRLTLHPMMQEYIRTWTWDEAMNEAADRMMWKLYDMIRPAGRRHDGSKQFPEDYGRLQRLLQLADQMVTHVEKVTAASQRLLYRLLMDAPVDQDLSVAERLLELLEDPRYLDDASILRLYETTAYYLSRLHAPREGLDLLSRMKQYLAAHPSAYYLSAYHRAMAVILHNMDGPGNLEKCLNHEECAIAAARLSSHPEAKKQLAACLLEEAVTLLSAHVDRQQARRLIDEARPLIDAHAAALDYEAYLFACAAAMCAAMDGDLAAAERELQRADGIAFAAPDSDLSAAEHLLEQTAPIRIAMGQCDRAAEAVLQAIALCDRHEEAVRYRETRFDAYCFLGEIYDRNGEYIKAEEAFDEAEKRAADWPFEVPKPLCPEEIRLKAAKERAR